MAKLYNQLLAEMAQKSPWPQSPADTAFIGLNTVVMHPDRNGNGDDVFKGTVKQDTSLRTMKPAAKLLSQMQKDLKAAAGGKDADGDHDGDVSKRMRKAVDESVNLDEAKTMREVLSNPEHRRKVDAIEDTISSLRDHKGDKRLRAVLDDQIHQLHKASGFKYPHGLDEEFLDESNVGGPGWNHRDAASHGIVHPDVAKKIMGANGDYDYYQPKTGDKTTGRAQKIANGELHIKNESGAIHKFRIASTYPGHGVKESVDLDEDVSELATARRMFHSAQGRHHDHCAFKCRERGEHAEAKKFDAKAKESFEKATRCAPIREETESLEQVISEANSYYNEKNAPYQTGDHVHHYSSAKYSGRSGKISKHGVVASHDGRTAKVHWEDGTKSSHTQATGNYAGKKPDHLSSYDDHRIRHNEVHDYSKGYASRKVLTNDEHKAHLKAAAEEKAAAYAHQRSHEEAQHKMASMHHSELKPHHLKAIHDILDRAKSGED